jgi:hypothetical protein
MQQTGRLPILVVCGRRIGISANMDPRYREPDRREVLISCDRSDLTLHGCLGFSSKDQSHSIRPVSIENLSQCYKSLLHALVSYAY